MKKDNIKPGEFFIKEGSPVKMPKPKGKPELEFGNDLISIYTAFRNKVYYPKSVLYPSCGFDASPSRVFSNVIFVDSENGNKGCIEALQKEGLNAIKQNIRDYIPKQHHDLLILLNPVIYHESATRHLSSGGWIIANDYHHTASDMYKDNNFLLWGGIDFIEKDGRKEDFRVKISKNIGGFFQPVRDMEEFRKLRPKAYNLIKKIAESLMKQSLLKVDESASLDEMFYEYRKYMEAEMPSKRVADRYIFIKK